MEYVKERASLYELTKAVRAWERKVEIAEVSFDVSIESDNNFYLDIYSLDGPEDQSSDMAPTVSAEQATDGAQPTGYTNKNNRSTTHVLAKSIV